MTKKSQAFIALVAFFSLALLLTGCQKNKPTENTNVDTQAVKENQADIASEEDYSSSEDTNTTSSDQDRTVIMLGRSVMYGWFEYWGSEEKVTKGKFSLEYQEMDSPPDIVSSVRRIMKSLPADKKDIVFFKFCFVDFEGGDGASANLEKNKKYIEDVYKVVVEEHGAKLIIGNALPQVSSDTEIYLVWNHQQYNSWLNDFWKQHPDNVTVFNMYKQLSDNMGALKEDYAIDEYDSHLNQKGYAALDKPFWEMMDSLY